MSGSNDYGGDRDENALDLIPCRDSKPKRPGLWNIIFHNDDVTEFDFVAHVLVEVFHKSPIEAFGITFEVHLVGKGVAGTYTFEVAREKRAEVLSLARIERFPLMVSLERA